MLMMSLDASPVNETDAREATDALEGEMRARSISLVVGGRRTRVVGVADSRARRARSLVRRGKQFVFF